MTDADPQVYADLQRLVDDMERVDWRDVPGFTASEAAALHARLVESRDELAEDVDVEAGAVARVTTGP